MRSPCESPFDAVARWARNAFDNATRWPVVSNRRGQCHAEGPPRRRGMEDNCASLIGGFMFRIFAAAATLAVRPGRMHVSESRPAANRRPAITKSRSTIKRLTTSPVRRRSNA